MGHELELGYIGIEVAEPAALDRFFGEVIGLIPGEAPQGGARTWRNDDRAQRVVVVPGPANDAAFVGFEASGAEVFDRIAGRLAAAGYTLRAGSDDDLAARRVERLARTTAPWGIDIELVTGLSTSPTPYLSPLVPGGFVTKGVGFGHVVFVTTAFDESQRFLTDGLGMAQSDWLEAELGGGMTLEVHFFHCNERHHSIALAQAPLDLSQTLHHILFEVAERDDVGRAFDRVWATDLTIANGLGRHQNDEMFSFYVASPVGFQIEVGHGGRHVSEPWTDDCRYDRISLWGHQPVARS